MKHLYLLRHAKSSWANPLLDDLDRPLNKRGKRQLSIMANILKDDGALSAKVYTSNAERAQQTINGIISESQSHALPEVTKKLYTFSRKKLLKWLYQLPDDEDKILIVGHNPALEELLGFLLKTPVNSMPTCAYVHLQIDTPSWSALSPLQASVKRYITPSSASYREFVRKTDKEEFKAKYKLQDKESPVQESLVKFYLVSKGLIPGCLVGLDPEFMHQYRVYLNKAIEIADTLYDLTQDQELLQHLDILKQHSEMTSELRDIDVLLCHVSHILKSDEREYAERLRCVSEYFQVLREEKLTQLKQAMESSHFHIQRKALKKYFNSESFAQLCMNIDNEKLLATQSEIEANVHSLMQDLQNTDDDEHFHEVRKLIRKSRYLGEQQNDAHKQDLKLEQSLEDKFGAFQDLCAQCGLLESYLLIEHMKQETTYESAKELLQDLQSRKAKQKKRICQPKV